jgi:hypothetical protein
MHISVAGFLRGFIDEKASLKIAVAGAVCNDPEIKELASRSSHIALRGFVDDLANLYSASRASVCPIGGAGTKAKLLESLQHRRLVFASERSLEGCFLASRPACSRWISQPSTLFRRLIQMH